MNSDRDISALASYDRDERPLRRTGPRREPPAICFSCGREMSDAEVLVRGSFCSGECEAHAADRSQR